MNIIIWGFDRNFVLEGVDYVIMAHLYVYSGGNKFIVFCNVATTLQNTTNLFPLEYTLFIRYGL